MGLFSGLAETLGKAGAKTGAKTVSKDAAEAAAKKSILTTIKNNPKAALGAAGLLGLGLYANTTGNPSKAIEPGQTVSAGGQAVGATDPTGTAAPDAGGDGSGSTTPAKSGNGSVLVYGGFAVGALLLVIALLFVLKKKNPAMGMGMQYFPQAYAPMPQPQFYPGMMPGRF